MSVLEYDNLGQATFSAKDNAKRDNCSWIIWHDRWSDNTTFWSPYIICDQFTVPGDYSDKEAQRYIQVLTVSPPKAETEAVYLTPDEKKLVAAVIDPDEIGRDYFPGSDETKTSLLTKLLGRSHKAKKS